ncbi:phage tail-collar fiber domain-containing protein [Pseudomonas guariconensis]|uniref:phage tail-collar fiber domain-containing protein n=1 Tax=Pseudomonas guariconensis TaxID=1288410 RepID=UPI002D1EFE40|nr:phage tail protein [Pseudomonas guariconensis]MEB3842500.1 phage tail protein [Pseudomonas guariconensis]MEB3875368.1 phage tail protein [Pseudomonas guariconensis]MEB3879221.1 phage tail protein [Pseudomonas guariconensis]MEB3897292.1 phage tail protein [Pseudomonas guariconensis]
MANSTTQFGGFLTNIGIAQQANSAALGVPWNITHMLIGDAGGDPSESPEPTPKPTQTALVRQVLRAQLNALYPSPADPAVLVAELVLPPEVGGWWIRELALEDANGNFVAVAKPAPSYKPLLAQGSGRTQTIRMHVVFGNVANINLKIDPSIVLATREYVDKAREAAELYTRNQLKAHTDAANPHPQYLLRSAVAKDSGPLAWLGDAAGTANALALTLKHAEATLTAYAAGQRFQFKATASNTGPVTAKIGGLAAVAVKKSEGGGLVDLVGGDIRAGALYDLNYDGTYFQLGGGVGAGKAFERFSFEASVAQAVFPARHTVGSIIVLRNGREVTDYVSDGETVTLNTPCEMGDSVQILVFGSFKTADTYTKAELQALLLTASALPVGGILPFPRGVVPAGYLELDGSVQKIATFPDLAAYLAGAFNKGDEPAGYFRLPDGRGEFLRGWDHGRGVDAGRAVGSAQSDSLKAHSHGLVMHRSSGLNGTPMPNVNTGNNSIPFNANGGSSNYTTITTGRVESDGGDETRPRNLAVMWCIKAWSAPVNQGQIDIGALVEELTALRSSTPVGAIVPFPKAEVPAGYLELDGSVQSAAAYPDLAAYLGTTYNTGGEPAGYFRLPDYRGEFLRGWDHGRGVDAGRSLGSVQQDALQNIVGSFTSRATDQVAGDIGGLTGAFKYGGDGANGGIKMVSSTTKPVTTISFDASQVTRTATETRPRNLAVMWCIKAWNAPVNQGQIDIGALAVQVSTIEQRQKALGDGQTNQNLAASRLLGTTYTNTSGRTIWLSVSVAVPSGDNTNMNIGPAESLQRRSRFTNSGTTGMTVTHSQPVLHGQSYNVTAGAGASVVEWNEVRA